MTDAERQEFSKLRHGGSCSVPSYVAVCPECGSTLTIQNDEWNRRTGMPTQSGFTTNCDREEELLDKWTANDDDDRSIGEAGGHRWWQSDWQPVRDAIWNWLKMSAVAAW